LGCGFGGAQAEEYRMTHLSRRGPFGEFHLGNEFWLNPGRVRRIGDLLRDGFYVSYERDKLLVNGAQRLGVEASPCLPRVFPAFALTHREYERTEIFAAAARLGEADDPTSCSWLALTFSHSRVRTPE